MSVNEIKNRKGTFNKRRKVKVTYFASFRPKGLIKLKTTGTWADAYEEAKGLPEFSKASQEWWGIKRVQADWAEAHILDKVYDEWNPDYTEDLLAPLDEVDHNE